MFSKGWRLVALLALSLGLAQAQQGLGQDFRFGYPGPVRVLQSAVQRQVLRSLLTIDAPSARVSVAECRSIAAFQLAGGLYADTTPSSSLFSNPASLVRRSPSPVTHSATAAPRSDAACRRIACG